MDFKEEGGWGGFERGGRLGWIGEREEVGVDKLLKSPGQAQ